MEQLIQTALGSDDRDASIAPGHEIGHAIDDVDLNDADGLDYGPPDDKGFDDQNKQNSRRSFSFPVHTGSPPGWMGALGRAAVGFNKSAK